MAAGCRLIAQYRFVCPDRVGVFGLGKCQVEFGQRRHPGDDFSGQPADLRREFGQHPAGFVPFGDHGFAQGIVEFHHRQRLDKQGRPGGGLVMHDGLDLALEFRPQRDDIAPVPLGDDAVLQLRGGGGIRQVALQAGHQPVVGNAHLPPQIVQFGRGAVGHFGGIGDAARDGFDQPRRARQAGGDVGQVRGGFGVFFEETPQAAHGHQRGLHIQQFLRVEHAAVRRQVHLCADVMRRRRCSGRR